MKEKPDTPHMAQWDSYTCQEAEIKYSMFFNFGPPWFVNWKNFVYAAESWFQCEVVTRLGSKSLIRK